MRPSIGVVVTLLPERRDFFEGFVLPSIERQLTRDDELLIADDPEEHVCAKRNRWRQLGTELVYFSDDDAIQRENSLWRLAAVLEEHSGASVAYCDYMGIAVPPVKHPKGAVFIQKQCPWRPKTLVGRNIIPTMSLWRRDYFLQHNLVWNEESIGFDDWDLALQLAVKGGEGIYVPEVLYHAYYWQSGRTCRASPEEQELHCQKKMEQLRERHGEWMEKQQLM